MNKEKAPANAGSYQLECSGSNKPVKSYQMEHRNPHNMVTCYDGQPCTELCSTFCYRAVFGDQTQKVLDM